MTRHGNVRLVLPVKLRNSSSNILDVRLSEICILYRRCLHRMVLHTLLRLTLPIISTPLTQHQANIRLQACPPLEQLLLGRRVAPTATPTVGTRLRICLRRATRVSGRIYSN